MGEKTKKFILEKRAEGKLVVMGLEGLMSMDVKEFIKQPVDGILYDLNRLEETALTFIDDPKWVNDFAVALTIRELYAQNELLIDALEHCGYDPEDCIDCGGPPHNDTCRFWKLRHVLSYWEGE
jgi:hypothetical protein